MGRVAGVVDGWIGLRIHVGVGLECLGRRLDRNAGVVGGWIGLEVRVGVGDF